MRIGIDLGGTKIEAIALDEKGVERIRRRVPTPATDYAAVVAAIAGLVHTVEQELGVSGSSIGIGTPGAISPSTRFVKNSNTTCLIGKPLDVDLERTLGRPVRLANDANCFALSEATDGAGAGADTVFGVILGTGTGGGVVVRGRVLEGANAIAGEWGHNPLPWPTDDERPGHKCYCGKWGCIETFVSGPGLARDYAKVTGQSCTADQIAALAAGGDRGAVDALERYEDRLARALAGIINVLDPNIIVLGGGVSNIERLYENVPLLWHKYVFSDTVATRLVRAKYGDSSGVRGAAWLWV
ncbi:MAG: ROK family protein [Deltaproteobacteria bacterium]|nr:ROK family protein [Deltaproteobacteria bacterium]